MLIDFFKIAWRNLFRNKFQTVISILGLALGLTCTILITLFIRSELSYDRYNTKHNRIYRLESHFNIQGSDDRFAVTSLPLAAALQEEYPFVESYTRFRAMDTNLFQYEDRKIFEEDVYFADSTVFDLFSFEMIKGSAKTALTEPNTMVITEEFAGRIFGQQDPLGKTVNTGAGISFTVKGVIRDLPENTHMKFQALCSMITLADLYGRELFNSLSPQLFWNVGFYSFILVQEGADINQITSSFQEVIYDKYMRSLGDRLNASFQLVIRPLADVHLYSQGSYDLPRGNIAYVYIFTVVAVFLLIIACINYMNLATARSARRALEVGIRKVAGAQRSGLSLRFLLESLLQACIALLIAILAASLLLPVFNQVAGKQLSLDFAANPGFLLSLIGITILVGLFAGSYPAFFLSSFLPVTVLKGEARGGARGALLRKLLVLLQFAISIAMIIGTITVIRQLNFMRNKDLGFEQENLVFLTIRDTSAVHNLAAFKTELSNHPNVLEVGTSSSVPGEGYPIIVQRVESNDGNMIEKGINFVLVDHDYLDVMKMNILEGRNFDPELQSDLEESSLINEAVIRLMNWGDDVLGRKIDFGANPDGEPVRSTRVIGVVHDFHYASLHNPIDPLLILLNDEPLRNICLRIKGSNINETLGFIESKWQEFCPTYPFEFRFLDDSLAELYLAEKKIGQVFYIFTGICIIIACLGLFGLASYTTELRTREIGIRKVMGAEVGDITLLLSREFTRWVLIANLIAWPVAWWALDKWLNNFAYRISVSLFSLLAAGFLALLIALITVIFQSLKAALTNPAEALKYE